MFAELGAVVSVAQTSLVFKYVVLLQCLRLCVHVVNAKPQENNRFQYRLTDAFVNCVKISSCKFAYLIVGSFCLLTDLEYRFLAVLVPGVVVVFIISQLQGYYGEYYKSGLKGFDAEKRSRYKDATGSKQLNFLKTGTYRGAGTCPVGREDTQNIPASPRCLATTQEIVSWEALKKHLSRKTSTIASESEETEGKRSEVKVTRLTTDYHWLCLQDFIWAKTVFFLNYTPTFVLAFLRMAVWEWSLLPKVKSLFGGLSEKSEQDMEKAEEMCREACGTVLLEGCGLPLYYVGLCKRADVNSTAFHPGFLFKKRQNEEENIGVWYFNDLHLKSNEGGASSGHIFVCWVDLDTKRFLGGVLDSAETLTCQESLILLWYHELYPTHTKIHAVGNWGIDPYDRSQHPYNFRNSVLTVLFNYLAVNPAGGAMEFFRSGKSEYNANTAEELVESLKEQCANEPLPTHKNIRGLLRYSRMVRFMLSVRREFKEKFEVVQLEDEAREKRGENRLFSARVEGEAYFIGTVLHSLHHYQLTTLLPNYAILCTDPKIGLLKEGSFVGHRENRFVKMSDLVRAGLLLIYQPSTCESLSTRFSESPLQFHREVYQYASKIDREFADQIETTFTR